MKYTIQVSKLTKKELNQSLVGLALIVIEDSIVIKNIKIVEGENGLFVAMPSVLSKKTGEYRDIVYPITADFRKELFDKILNQYHIEVENQKPFEYDTSIAVPSATSSYQSDFGSAAMSAADKITDDQVDQYTGYNGTELN